MLWTVLTWLLEWLEEILQEFGITTQETGKQTFKRMTR